MSSISAVSSAGYHPVVPVSRPQGSAPAAPAAPQPSDPDHDGDHDAPGRVDVEA